MKKILSFFNRSEKISFFGILALLNLAAIIESGILMCIVPYVGIVNQDPTVLSYISYFVPDRSINHQVIFWTSTAVFFILILVKSIVQLVSQYLVAKFPYSFYNRKTSKLFDRYLSEDYSIHVNQETGTMVKHSTQTNYHATEAIYYQLQIYSNLSVIFFLLIGMLIQNVWVSLVLIAIFIVAALAFSKFIRSPMQDLGKQLVTSSKTAYQWAIESLSLFKEIRIYHKSDYFKGQFNECVAEIADNYRKREWLSKLPVVLFEFLAVVMLLAVVSYVYLTGEVTSHFVAMLIFYAIAGRRILPALNLVTQQFIYLSHAMESLLAFEAELKRPGFSSQHAIQPAINFENRIEFEQVSFSYEENLPVLDQISFEIQKNQSVAFVGPSGGGKSTLIDMITGLLKPNSGGIRVDQQIFPETRPLQSLIGYVPQSIALINDTIAKNIAIGEESIDFDRLNEVLIQSHLSDFIEKLPHGIETVVGDKGIKISGGQMQRIGIARALYRRPEILIFDEATSSLDPLSEMAISHSIHELAGKKTLVAIAHRLSTVKNFDTIYVLDRGKILSSGDHHSLIKTCPLYQKLNSTAREDFVCVE